MNITELPSVVKRMNTFRGSQFHGVSKNVSNYKGPSPAETWITLKTFRRRNQGTTRDFIAY